MRTVLAVLAAFVSSLVACPALASFHTFVVDQLYSSADGEIQFIVLRESANANGQNLLAGHTLTSTHAGVVKTFAIASNLPGSGTAGQRYCRAARAVCEPGLR